MFERFDTRDVAVNGTVIRCRVGGSGPALLLLHGHPQSHVMWHRVAPTLAEKFSIVCADLRGYGDSARPGASLHHAAYSKRTMAQDMADLMTSLGHQQFRLAAHDRGARVAHRLLLDHPGRVQRAMLLDIAPTLAMYEQTTEAFAKAYWHWFFLIQPAPLPERLIDSDPAAYIRDVMGRRHAGLAAFAPDALQEYLRCIAIPGTATAICEDYRASAGIDLEHDRADRANRHQVTTSLRVLWGAEGAVGRCFPVLDLWREAATDVSGKALDCGHYIAEEQPAKLLEEMGKFFAI
ncbi:alpha/beta hydrolase [Comamonas piscis]|uniref:Alpha/beta hydrolase n=1 Tax=Comamonas piscis TaxID=1562974 RepID=A0A7G5EKW5_9BURK|nr:alpha/beta hydrolase [Comamonas piscis]QMV74640.1 alpha/beta hydrolase [Comamonas piscis]WSO33103.1 alpha/beta hydrolase [Comamonas piscis]